MPTARFQPSFAGGVISPALFARIDTQRYDVGLRIGNNVFVEVHGGVSNRAGTKFVGEVPDSSSKHRLIPFSRSEDENLILVFGPNTLRIVEQGAYLEIDGSPYQITTPYNEVQSLSLDYAQSVDVVFLAHDQVPPQRLSRFSNTNWTFETWAVNPNNTPPDITSIIRTHSGIEEYSYVVSSVVDGVESLPSAPAKITSRDLNVDGTRVTINWQDIGASEYNVYKERNGVFGFAGYTSETTFVDDNIAQDLQDTPIVESDLFQSENNYPAVVGLIQQRLVAGRTINAPETIFLSRIGDFENFTSSRVLSADDSFESNMTANGIAAIRSLLQLRELLVFTSTGEFSLTGPNNTITATSPIQTQYGYSGASRVKPVVVEDTALFVDRTGRQVRDLRYDFSQDGYAGNDLTIFVPDYFEQDRIAGWAFSKDPYSVVWVYTESGRLFSLTYKREHQVWAWCDHDLQGGVVEQVEAIEEGDYDRVYLIIRREINGQTKRYIERLDDRQFKDVEDAWFVDSGVKYEGEATNIVSGLDHLEGETVTALADGNVIENLVVQNGTVTIQIAASKVIVGLPFAATIETLPPAIELQDVGSSRGRPIKINRCNVQVEDTRGISAGPNVNELNELIQTKVDLARRIPLFTGMVQIPINPSWNREGTVVLQQSYPLPMTVLGVALETTVGRSD